MLSHDELNNGSTFILKLQNAAGVWFQWVQTLYGDTARHWYGVWRDSDWGALRAEAAAVFEHSVSESEAEIARKSGRCVFIHPSEVTVEQLAPAGMLRRPGVAPKEGVSDGTGAKAPPLTLLSRDQLDARLVDGERLLLVHIGPDAEPHCRVLYREEEVPIALFAEYCNLGLIRPVGDAGVYM